MTKFFNETLYPFKSVESYYGHYEEDTWPQLLEKFKNKQKKYILAMFPYPSGNIHCGHVRNFLYVDLMARYYRFMGYAVINPLGWDSFGLPAENAAKEAKINPKSWTEENIKKMKNTLKDLGFALDWSMELATHSQEYYYQQQKIFADIFKNNLCYKKKGLVFWDPKEGSVLSKEQVIDGKGWRSGHPVEMKIMDQWYFKITQYVEPLLQGIETLTQWPNDIKSMQKQWIGKSQGFIIDFKIKDTDKSIEVFTTKPQMLYGCTFIGLSLTHPWSISLTETNESINNFIKTSLISVDKKDYRGIFTGYYGFNPINHEEVPVYITTYVTNDFGTGAVYGVPAHNLNDYNFAQTHSLPMKFIVEGDTNNLPFSDGIMINCLQWNGKNTDEALDYIKNNLSLFPFIKIHYTYNLHDWSFARQRYWGCPIPLINCDQCGVVVADLNKGPVTLPEDVDFSLDGNPLDNHPTWKYTFCPQCQGPAIRETSTMDTFVDSCWYFYRYFSKTNEPIDKNLLHLMPVDIYIGGKEHAVSHLMYCRFFTKMLKDMGYVNIEEPVTKLINQGFVCMATYYDLVEEKYLFPKDVVMENPKPEDIHKENYDGSSNKLLFSKNGNPVKKGAVQKMSKSKKNIIDPYEIKDVYGVDVLRFTMISDNPADINIEIRQESFTGAYRFLNQVWMLGQSIHNFSGDKSIDDKSIIHINNILEKIQKNFENLEVNILAVNLRAMVKILDEWVQNNYDKSLVTQYFNNFLKIFSMVCPYISKALWDLINKNENFYKDFLNIKKIDYNINVISWKIMINNKFKCCLELDGGIDEKELENKVKDFLKMDVEKMFIIKNRNTINIIK